MIQYVTPICRHCGKDGVVELTEQEFRDFKARVLPIQKSLVRLDAGIREQVKTGIHAQCWDEMFPEDDEF